MALIEVNKNPSRRELFWFGAMLAVFLGVVGAVVYWRFDARGVAYGLWSLGLGIAIVYYAVPTIRRPIYLGWIYAAYPIGWTISHLLLAVIYYGLLTPIGLIMRLSGRDLMQRRFDPKAKSYWIPRRNVQDPTRYFKQF